MDVFEQYVNSNTAKCARCGRLCNVSKKPNKKARLMKYATERDVSKGIGVCADCSATNFIKSIESLMSGIEKNGVKMLLKKDIQVAFGSVMSAGKSDATIPEINWQNVVDNWDKQ